MRAAKNNPQPAKKLMGIRHPCFVWNSGTRLDAATYNVTPALSFMGLVGVILTAQAVDTDTNTQNSSTRGSGSTLGIGTPVRTTVSQNSWVKGDSNYLGTELNGLMTWRFSPNAAFTLGAGYLFSGSALNTAECTVPVAANGIPVAAAANCED